MTEIPQGSWFCSVCVACTVCEKHGRDFEEETSAKLYGNESTPLISSVGMLADDVKRILDRTNSRPNRPQRDCWGTSLSMCCVCSEDKASRLQVLCVLHHNIVPSDAVVYLLLSSLFMETLCSNSSNLPIDFLYSRCLL